jgi:hypothetical protein
MIQKSFWYVFTIPQTSDFTNLRERMYVIVGRVICQHIHWFREHFSNVTIPHIVHKYTTESTGKSVLINLSVFDEDPCSTQGAIGI